MAVQRLAREDWPPRARIRGLVPIGLGTGDVESCSGLIVRLAAENRLSVRRFVERVLVKLADEGAIPGISAPDMESLASGFIRHAVASVNGAWGTARTWVGILEAVTLQPGIESATLAAWADRLSNRALLRTHRAFCPVCLYDWAAAGRVAYEPLRWQFQVLEVCVEHGVWLREECPERACGRKRAVTAGWASTDYCTGCRGRLARSLDEVRETEEPLDADALDWARFVDAQLRDILARRPGPDAEPGAPFGDLLAVAIESTTDRNQEAFARRIGMTEASVSYWKVGRRTPSLTAMLRVCRVAGFDLRDVLLGDLAAVKASRPPVAPPYVAPSLETHRVLDHTGAREVLEAALVADPPPSLKSVAKAADFNPRYLHRTYTQLWVAVRERRMTWVAAQAAALRSQRSGQIDEGVRTLTALGVYPSRNQLMKRELIGGAWLRQPEYRDAWRDALVRAGWQDPSGLRRAKGEPTPVPTRRSPAGRQERS